MIDGNQVDAGRKHTHVYDSGRGSVDHLLSLNVDNPDVGGFVHAVQI